MNPNQIFEDVKKFYAERDMEHVYFAAKLGDRWIPLDPQEMTHPGREPPHARRHLHRVD